MIYLHKKQPQESLKSVDFLQIGIKFVMKVSYYPVIHVDQNFDICNGRLSVQSVKNVLQPASFVCDTFWHVITNIQNIILRQNRALADSLFDAKSLGRFASLDVHISVVGLF